MHSNLKATILITDGTGEILDFFKLQITNPLFVIMLLRKYRFQIEQDSVYIQFSFFYVIEQHRVWSLLKNFILNLAFFALKVKVYFGALTLTL